MNQGTIISGTKLTMLILSLSISGLVLASVLPMISVSENDAVKEELYFNYEMMENSNNVQINSLASDLNLITTLFWAMIIVSLISFLSITFLTFLKKGYSSLTTILSAILLILGTLVVVLQFNFIATVENNKIASLSSIASSLNYIHIPLLFGIVILICSIVFVLIFILELIKKIIGSKKEKKRGKKSEEVPLEQTSDKQISPTLKTVKKKVEMENWLKGEIKNIDEKTEKEELIPLRTETVEPLESTSEKLIDVEKEELDEATQDEERIPLEPFKESDEITISDDKRQTEPFPPEKVEETPKETDELKLSPSFENALSSAIQKKQSESGKREQTKPKSKEVISEEESQPVEETSKKEELYSDEKEIITTEIIVKCPQCKNIFAVKKEGETTKIKCPKCGKEGVTQ